MPSTQTKIVCPLCFLNRPDYVFHSKEDNAYGSWDADKAIIQIRDIPGGKKTDLMVGTGKYRKSPGKGFPMIDAYTIDVAKKMPEYQEYLEKISVQLLKVVRIFKEEGLISEDEIKNTIK